MDQLAAMRAFVRVVEAGSFTRAADLLTMPKATLSKHIQALEAHLRTRLLARTTRRVTVTPDGAAYYERALALLNELDELDGSMSSAQANPRGRLRIDISPSIASALLIPALPDFLARYRDIEVDVGCTDRPVDLVGENVDCVIRAGELGDPSLIARHIADMAFITVASPAYLSRYGTPRHPAELDRDHLVVRYFSARTGRYHAFPFRRGEEVVEVDGRFRIATNDGNAYLSAGLAGIGILTVPAFMVANEIRSGTLVPVLQDWEIEDMPLHVVYSPSRHLSNRLRVFVDWVAELFAGSQLLRGALPSAPALPLPERSAKTEEHAPGDGARRRGQG